MAFGYYFCQIMSDLIPANPSYTICERPDSSPAPLHPHKAVMLTFSLPPQALHAPGRLSEACSRPDWDSLYFLLYQYFKTLVPSIQYLNNALWSQGRKKPLALSLMGFQSGHSRELAQTCQAGLQLNMSYAEDDTAQLKTTRRGSGVGKAAIQVASATNLSVAGNTSVLWHDSRHLGYKPYHEHHALEHRNL